MKHCIFPRCDCPERGCKARLPIVIVWASNFGDIRLPDDFPTQIFRRDGWWDGRFTTLREKWEPWIATEEAKLRGEPEPVTLEFNRLHGAVINARGEAI